MRWIVERCLAKEPEERYASTKDLARDLRSVRDHLSETSARARPSPLARLARPRRSAWLVPAALALIAGAALGIARGRGAVEGEADSSGRSDG